MLFKFFKNQVLKEMTDGGVDRSIECTGVDISVTVSAFECVHDVSNDFDRT